MPAPYFRLVHGRFTIQGRKELVLRDIRRWTGELPWDGVGEFLHSKIAFHTSAASLLALVTQLFRLISGYGDWT